MTWAETIYITQQFYNAYDLDNRLTLLENQKMIVAAADSDGNPEDVDVSELTDGSIWFEKE